VIEDDRLVGMEFDILEWDEGARHSTTVDTVVIPCDDVIAAIGQENSFPWIRARPRHELWRMGYAPK